MSRRRMQSREDGRGAVAAADHAVDGDDDGVEQKVLAVAPVHLSFPPMLAGPGSRTGSYARQRGVSGRRRYTGHARFTSGAHRGIYTNFEKRHGGRGPAQERKAAHGDAWEGADAGME